MSERPDQYRCRHLFTDGRRCGSASLRHEALCYYHHTTRRPIERTRALALQTGGDATGTRQLSAPELSPFDLPLPEDRHAIQCAIGAILQRIAANQIDSRRAAALLYGLSVASANLPRPRPIQPAPEPEKLPDPETEVVLDPELGLLAPTGEPLDPERKLNSADKFLLKLERDRCAEAEKALADAIARYPDLAPPQTKGVWQGGVFIPSAR